MRRLTGLALICVSLLASLLIGRAGEERNVRALALHLGCSPETARRLYRLARKDGYGAAYMRVFPGDAIPGIRPF
jgi:hypothetical protein